MYVWSHGKTHLSVYISMHMDMCHVHIQGQSDLRASIRAAPLFGVWCGVKK